MLSLPPEQTLALIRQEHAELRRQAAQDALADAALRERRLEPGAGRTDWCACGPLSARAQRSTPRT